MFKVLHIHTDPKFLTYNSAFEDSSFSNTIMYISGMNQDIHKLYPDYDIIEIENSNKGLKEAIRIANSADLIVVYMMDICKSYICNRVNPSIPIIWRFFGAELYGMLSSFVFSELTKQLLGKQKYPFIERVNNAVSNILTYGVNYRSEFKRSTVRANAIAMLYRQEYDFLSKYFLLPTFLQLSYNSKRHVHSLTDKTSTIIIGNSRNRYNNHLDILRLIRGGKYSNYSFELPFNYGEESIYSNTVFQEAELILNCHIIKDYMARSEYSLMFSNSAAFVFNAHRQMAMGNIFIALENNTKVYLNKKNSAYQWLLDEGFKVFSIEELADDLDTGNIYLTKEESNKNSITYNNLSQKYNVGSFINEIQTLIIGK